MSSTNRNQELCSVCQAQPQDMLILSCRHNLCLDCATEVYNLNSKQDQIVCEICLSQTSLDEDTIVCLRSLSAKNIRQNNQQKNNYDNEINYQINLNLPPHPPKNYHNNQGNSYSNKKNNNNPGFAIINQNQSNYNPALNPLCQTHNQPLTYFCLECNFFKICSQCMLLENHRYHKVITLKKATFHIKDIIQKVGREKLKLKTLLEKDRESLAGRKDESEEQLEKNLNMLKTTFDEVNRLILKKYQEVKEKMQSEARRKLQIMQGAINQISDKIMLIQETVEFQDQLISSATSNTTSTPGNMFKMFEYYQSQMNHNKINFQPSLPNFISEVEEENFYQKDKVIQQFQYLLEQLVTRSSRNQNNGDLESSCDENINYMSQIQNLVGQDVNLHKQAQKNYKNQILIMKNQRKNDQYEEKSKSKTKYEYKRPLISDNISIIQINRKPRTNLEEIVLNAKINKKQTQTKNNSKSAIQALKRKARQNFKDRDLANSRKMELSRSIVNATDILNKIQQRTSKM